VVSSVDSDHIGDAFEIKIDAACVGLAPKVHFHVKAVITSLAVPRTSMLLVKPFVISSMSWQ